jgi:predicted RNA-binding Zn ribbon-like protein
VAGSELVGNALCLDFANTVNKRPDPDRDRLGGTGDLMRWALSAGLRTSARAARPDTASTEEARDLREAIYRVFSGVAAGRAPAAADTATIMATYADGVAAARLHREDARFTLAWPSPWTVRRVIWAVAASAAQLLLQGPLDRIGECPSCGWLFLDTSRNGQRRWCSMAVCGGRAKARRHYGRTRAQPG